MIAMYRGILLALTAMLLSAPVRADSPPPSIRIGVLVFGTLNWELSAIHNEGLDRSDHFRLETISLATPESGKIALQGGSVDLVVADWIWAARQRDAGMDFVFAPYSTSHGALMVPRNSPIHGIADLKGKRLGIAGGGLDKNWLLLRAMAQKTEGVDLERDVEKVFGAPPLLNQQLQHSGLDAVLNYWNFAATLEAQGYRRLLDGSSILRGLDIPVDVPALGYVFRKGWAKANKTALSAFFRAADAAQNRICESDSVWREILPLTREADEKVQSTLRQHYCEGRVKRFGDAEKEAVEKTYTLIGQLSGQRELQGRITLPQGFFWTP